MEVYILLYAVERVMNLRMTLFEHLNNTKHTEFVRIPYVV